MLKTVATVIATPATITTTLYLFFPQWQGSGETPEILHGAHILKKNTKISFPKVRLSKDNHFYKKHNIFAHKQILEQLKSCKKIINKKLLTIYLLLAVTVELN